MGLCIDSMKIKTMIRLLENVDETLSGEGFFSDSLDRVLKALREGKIES